MHQIRKSEYTQPTPIQCQVSVVTLLHLNEANRMHAKVPGVHEGVYNSSFLYRPVTEKNNLDFSG